MTSPIKQKNNQFLQSIVDNRETLARAKDKHRHVVLTLDNKGRISNINTFKFEFVAKIAAIWRKLRGAEASFAGSTAQEILSVKSQLLVPHLLENLEKTTKDMKLSHKATQVDNNWVFEDTNNISELENNQRALKGNITALSALGMIDEFYTARINNALASIERNIHSLKTTSAELIKNNDFFSSPLPVNADLKKQLEICLSTSNLLDKSGNIIDQSTINSLREKISTRMIEILQKSKEKLKLETSKIEKNLTAKKTVKSKKLVKLNKISKNVGTQYRNRLSLEEIAQKRGKEKHISPLFNIISKVGFYLDEQDIYEKSKKGKEILKIAAAENLPIDAELLQHPEKLQRVLTQAIDKVYQQSEGKLKEVRQQSSQGQVMKLLNLDPEIPPEDHMKAESKDIEHRELDVHLEINSWIKGLNSGLKSVEQELAAKEKKLHKELDKAKEADKDEIKAEIKRSNDLHVASRLHRLNLESQIDPKVPKEPPSEQVKMLKEAWDFIVNDFSRNKDGSLNLNFFKDLIPKLNTTAKKEMQQYISEGEDVDVAGLYRLQDLSGEIDLLQKNRITHKDQTWQLELYIGLVKQPRNQLPPLQKRFVEDLENAVKSKDKELIQRATLSLQIIKILIISIDSSLKVEQTLRNESLLLIQLNFAKEVLKGYQTETVHAKDQLKAEGEVVKIEEDLAKLRQSQKTATERSAKLEDFIKGFQDAHLLASQSDRIADAEELLAA